MYDIPKKILKKQQLFRQNLSVITRASFCCTKKLKKLHLFLAKAEKVAFPRKHFKGQ